MITNNPEDQELSSDVPQFPQNVETFLGNPLIGTGFEIASDLQTYGHSVPGLLPIVPEASFVEPYVVGSIADQRVWRSSFSGAPVGEKSRHRKSVDYRAGKVTAGMERKKKTSSGGRTVSGSLSGFSAASVGEGSSQSYGLSSDNSNDLNTSRSHVYGMGDNYGHKGKKPEMGMYQTMSEDMRISKLLRRLSMETYGPTAIEVCKKLQQSILDPSNTAFVRRAFDCLADSLVAVLENGPDECLIPVSIAFGLMGYVIRHDFHIYKNWIFKNFDSMKSLRKYLMRALKETLRQDANNLDLISYSDRLIVSLKDTLECADRVEDFIAVSDVIAEFALNYNKSFEKHFTDIVDIVVGWHLETEQPCMLKEHCCRVLQSFSDFFIKKDEFTFGLMSQFLEDIVTFGEDIENPKSGGTKSPNAEKSALPEVSVGSFIGAFNSILKCLISKENRRVYHINPKLFEEAIEIIIRVAYQSMRITSTSETVQNVNEFLYLILSNDRHSVSCDFNKIFDILKLEMSQYGRFDAIQISTFLYVMLHFVKELQANTPIEFIAFVFEPQIEEFSHLKVATNMQHYKLLVKLYHEILGIKNVPLLQEAYKYILKDMRGALECLRNPPENAATRERIECVLSFSLIAIADLATQTSSIIGMYALQPSILELLIKDLDLANMSIWTENPVLHYSCIHLLAVHCMKNNNYVMSSSLLINNVFSKLSLEDLSPTAENFSMILKYLGEIINAKQVSEKTIFELLDWIQFVYHQCGQYAKPLTDNPDFVEIAKSVCKLSVKSTVNIVLECSKCIDLLFKYEHLNIEIFRAIAEASCIQICSTNRRIREAYSRLLAKLPLNAALMEAQDSSGVVKSKDLVINDLQRWYISTTLSANLRENYFKKMFELISLKESAQFVGEFLMTIFPRCWIAQKGRGAEFFSLAQNNFNYLLAWAEWEFAEFCINNKLRTPLGKPQETLLNVEALIREGAQILSEKNSVNINNVETLNANQKHLRILLRIVECMEKSIYNAAEGTAFAIPAPEKPVRTFFKINTSTCNEWFNRIRTAMDLVAMHSIDPEMIIRCSESLLKALVAGERTGESAFEHTLILYTWALIRNREADSLHGVYLWAKRVSGKRFTWIKSATEHAAGHKEKAADGYMSILATKEDEHSDGHVRAFITDQLEECLYFTNQWEQLKKLKANQVLKSEQQPTIPVVCLSLEQVNSLQTFDESGDASILGLANWEVLERSDNFTNNCSYNTLLTLSENTLMNIALEHPDQFDESKWDVCSKIFQSGIEDFLLSKPKDFLNHFVMLNHIAQKIKELQMPPSSSVACNLKSLNIDRVFGSNILCRVLRWAEFLESVYNLGVNETIDLCLKTASVARKEGNLKFSKLVLKKYFRKVDSELIKNDLTDTAKLLAANRIPNIAWKDDTIRGIYEVSKWIYCQTGKQEEAIQLVSTCCLGALSTGTASEDISRSLLTLSDWLGQANESILAPEENSALKVLLNEIPQIGPCLDENIDSIIPSLDKAAGKFIHCSTKHCPELAKAWSALGGWSYRWGRKVFEQHASGGLRTSDVDAIKALIPDASSDDIDRVVSMLTDVGVVGDDEEIGPNEVSSTEILESRLRSIKILSDVEVYTIQSVIDIWRQAHKSVYAYYEMAASAYFKYLTLASASDALRKNGDCSTVTATLRLLRLIVKHALGLQEVLEEGLSTTPTHPWKLITPQLFSRLNHHELYVRKRVSELLCRVANDSPHLIIFPAVVGAAQETSNNDDERNNDNSTLILCYNSLLDTLSQQAPETVTQVQLLVRELKRITLLWDEYWLHSLAQLYSEYSEIFRTLETDARKYADDKLNLIAEKHRILMNHVIKDMQRIGEVTSRSPETNYERNFQEKYSKVITATIEELKKPFNSAKPNDSSQKIKQLYLIFQQRLQKSTQSTLKTVDISPVLVNMKSTAISMPGVEASENNQIFIKSMDSVVYILPTKTKPKKLAFFGSNGKKYTYLFKGLEDLHLDERIMQFLSIANTMISKPIDLNGHAPLYRAYHYSVIPLGSRSGLISWVDGVVPIFGLYKKWQQREAANPKKEKQFTVLRPSELFYNKLTPLLAENNIKTINNRKSWPISVLRQVLEELTQETPHDLLAKELWCYSNNAAYWRRSVRNYSVSVAVMSVIGYVIGLGDRHLDNVLVKLSTGEIVHIDYNVCFEKGKTLRVPEKVPFRMTPNLEAALGITGIEGTFRLACEHVLKTLRKERETLLTLLEAFVYDPLVDWAVSDDGTTSNSRATSVLAAAAEIVALTANINTSSNFSSGAGKKDVESEIEIRERDASETAIGTQEVAVVSIASTSYCADNDVTGSTLATSLDKKQSRKKLENEVMRDTLTSRFAEIKPEWTQYRDEVHEQLVQMIEYLDDLEMQRKQMQKDEYERDLLTKQMAMIREVETLGTAMSSHSINTLSQRYSVYRKSTDEFNQVKRILSEKSLDYANKIEAYLMTLSQACEANIDDMQNRLNSLCQLEIPNEFEYVKDFLKTSAQEVMYLQADQARKELDASYIQQSFIIKIGLEALAQYHHVICFLPQSELEKNRLFRYEKLTKDAENNPERCENTLKEFNTRITEENNDNDSDQILNYAHKLESLWIEENFTLRKNCEALQSQLTDANDMLIDAKNCVQQFIETHPGSIKALECVYLNLLIDTRNQLHAFELASLQAITDPYLILSEELSYLKLIVETSNSLFASSDIMQSIDIYLDLLGMISSTVQSLKDIEGYFKSKFIPKMFQCVMSNQSSLIPALRKLQEYEYDLDTVLEKLDNGLAYEGDYFRIMDVMSDIRQSLNDEDADYFGHFESLFEVAINNMENCHNDLQIVLQNAKMNHVPDPFLQEITLNAINNFTSTTLRQGFEIRKIQTLVLVIQEAEQLSQSILLSDLEAVFDHKILYQPLARFIFEFECNFFFGLGPYLISLLTNELLSHLNASVLDLGAMPLDIAVATAVDQHLMLNTCSNTEYAFAQALCLKLCLAIKQKAQVDYLEELVAVQNEIINQIRLIASVHVWLNEKSLPSPPPFGHIIHKSVLFANFQNATQNLNAWKISIQKINDELMSFTRAVVQRLKWAVGANPSLSGLQQMFTECLEKQETKFKQHCEIASNVLLYCTSIVTFENLKLNTVEITKSDEKLSQLLKELSKKYKVLKQSASQITPVEEGLVQLLDPEGTVDHCWINNVSGLLDEMTDAMQRKIASLEKDLVTTQDNLQMSAHKLRSLMDTDLRMDVRYLLKLILKVDKNNQATKYKQFQSNYKQFLMRINDLHIKVLSKDFTEEIVREIRDIIVKLIEDLVDIYDELLKLMNGPGYVDIKERDRKDVKLSGTPIRENKKGNQPEQKRNAYAVSVWRRIRMKLEGRDPDPNRRLSVAEQVDWMIREAMNPDNLAVLYEGWTPWV